MDRKDRDQNTGRDAGQSSRPQEHDTRKSDERVKGSGSSNERSGSNTQQGNKPQRQPGRLPLPD